jgi:hypothetical protein
VLDFGPLEVVIDCGVQFAHATEDFLVLPLQPVQFHELVAGGPEAFQQATLFREVEGGRFLPQFHLLNLSSAPADLGLDAAL